MPKSILMVDPDASLRAQTGEALQAQGYEFQENPDGRQALDQVRELLPDVVILNVELPKGSGYALCSKLRKDDGLKGVKVILTSAEASPKAFDDHRKLKFGRADEYLLKPFTGLEMARKIAELLGDEFHEPPEDRSVGAELEDDQGAGDERISMEDIEEIAVEEDVGSPAALPGEGDVDLLEDAFQRLEEQPAEAVAPEEHTSLEALVGEDLEEQSGLEDEPLGSPLEDHAHEVLQALQSEPEERTIGSGRSAPSRPPRRGDPSPAGRTPSDPPQDFAQLKDKLTQRDRDLLRLREDLNARDRDLLEQRERVGQVERELAKRKDDVAKRDAQIRQLQQRIEALIAGQRRGEKDLLASREEARAALVRAEAAEHASSEAQGQARERDDSVEQLRSDLESTRQRLGEVQAELEQFRSRNDTLDAEAVDIRGHLAELEANNQKQEERLMKAYQRLQDGERTREKTKQALALALQLLEEAAADPDLAEDDEQRN